MQKDNIYTLIRQMATIVGKITEFLITKNLLISYSTQLVVYHVYRKSGVLIFSKHVLLPYSLKDDMKGISNDTNIL